MLCPEGYHMQNEATSKEEEHVPRKMTNKVPAEGTNTSELNSYKNPKTWKKSLSNFFRYQLRSTRSNDGDVPSENKEQFEGKEMSPEHKWQSLGKVFRRQSFAEHWGKSSNQQGECSSHSKRFGVRKVISSYFGKSQKTLAVSNEK